MQITRVVCALVLAGSLASATAARAAATLAGASPLRVLQKVDYRARGLAPVGSYSLRIRRNVTHNGRTYRCAAYLSGRRRAGGTERFRGSVPSGLQCVPTRGERSAWRPRTLKGSYQAVVCVAADRKSVQARLQRRHEGRARVVDERPGRRSAASRPPRSPRPLG